MLRRLLVFVAVALLGALLGMVLSYYPTVRDDLIFLHRARMTTEYQEFLRQQQASQPSSSGHVEPGPPKPQPEPKK